MDKIRPSNFLTTATDSDFNSGMYVGIDGADGTKKLPMDLVAKQSKLETTNGNVTALTTYAQNVAHSIAPAFDPTRDSEHAYPAGYSVTYTDGKVYTFKVSHYGPWDLADVTDDNLFDLLGTANNDCIKSENPKLLFYVAGKKIDSEGMEVTDVNYKLNTYSVEGFDSVIVEARIGSSAYVGFYDSNNDLVESYPGNANDGINFKKTLDVPSGAVTLKVSIGIRTTDYYLVSNSKTFLAKIENTARAMSDKTVVDGGVLDSFVLDDVRKYAALDNTGAYVDSSNYNCNIYKVKQCVNFIYVTARIASSYAIVFEDSNGVVLGYEQGKGIVSDSRIVNFRNEKLQLPTGTKTVKIPYSRTAPIYVFSDCGKDAKIDDVGDNSATPLLIETHLGKVIRNDGIEYDSASYNVGVYNVSNVKKFHLYAKVGQNAVIMFFNYAGNSIHYIQGRATPNVYVNNFDNDIDVPYGSMTMKIGYGNNTPFSITNVNLLKTIQEVDKRLFLFGKKVAFIGSSTTEGYGVTDGQNYVNIFANLTGCTPKNLGVSSTCVANNVTNGTSANRFVTRATPENLGDVNLVVVQIASNDMSYDSKAIGPHFKETTITPSGNVGDKELGAITDTDTFAGALHELITTIQTNVPVNTPIVVITPHHVGKNVATNPNSMQCNSHGDFITDFVSAIKDICSFYGVGVLDIYSMGQINKLAPNFAGLFIDGVHFNNKGHYMLANLLVEFIRNNVSFI